MGAIDNAEDDLFGAAGILILLLAVGAGILIYLSVHNLSVPEGAYPYPLFNRFASWVDGIFYQLGGPTNVALKPVQDPIDQGFAVVGNWINDHLPHTRSDRAALAEDNPVRDAALQETGPLYDLSKPYAEDSGDQVNEDD